jgi:hypothetical protein
VSTVRGQGYFLRTPLGQAPIGHQARRNRAGLVVVIGACTELPMRSRATAGRTMEASAARMAPTARACASPLSTISSARWSRPGHPRAGSSSAGAPSSSPFLVAIVSSTEAHGPADPYRLPRNCRRCASTELPPARVLSDRNVLKFGLVGARRTRYRYKNQNGVSERRCEQRHRRLGARPTTHAPRFTPVGWSWVGSGVGAPPGERTKRKEGRRARYDASRDRANATASPTRQAPATTNDRL